MTCQKCEKREKSYVVIDLNLNEEENVCEKCVDFVFEKHGKVKVFPSKDSDLSMEGTDSGTYRYEIQEI